MEIYADEHTERVYVRHDRGPYRVLDRDGSVGESHIPRGADLLFVDGESDYDVGFVGESHIPRGADLLFVDGESDYDVGFDEGHAAGREEALDEAEKLREEAAAERRRLTFLLALRHRPLGLSGWRP